MEMQRIDRTTRNRDNAKLRTAKKKEVWDALDKEKELDLPFSQAGQATQAATSDANATGGSTNQSS